MEQCQRSNAARGGSCGGVRGLWVLAAAVMLATYAFVLFQAAAAPSGTESSTLSAQVGTGTDAINTQLGTETASPSLQQLELGDEADEQDLEALYDVPADDELPNGNERHGRETTEVVEERQNLRVQGSEALFDTRTANLAVLANQVPSATTRASATASGRAKESNPQSRSIPGEDALKPVHVWTSASALDDLLTNMADEKEGTSDVSTAIESTVTDIALEDDDVVLSSTASSTTDEPDHLWTSASYFDNLPSDVSLEDDVVRRKAARFDDSRLIQHTEGSAETVPFEDRHDVIAGYDATLEYLQKYLTPEGSNEQLFLFFVCSDANGTAFDWKPICADAKKLVYDVFAKSPSSNRLVTIYAGPEEAWRGPNLLKEDDDLRLKSIPSIMRWDGGARNAKRSTYGMMIDETVLYEPFLRYLFRNTDKVDQRLAHQDVGSKEIVTVKGYDEYKRFMTEYQDNSTPYPLFLILYSGRWKSNNRLWCPFSRQSELPLEYAFYAFAPSDSRFLIVETFDLYKQWKDPENAFKKDPELAPKGVPWFFRVYPEGGGYLLYQRVKQRFYILEALQWVFEGST